MSKVSNVLKDKYDEYLELLSVLCLSYDTLNKDILALPIATSIRVLIHDTGKSTSLLKHIGKKDINFVSTNSNLIKEKIHLGLVRRINVGVSDGVGGEAKYLPLCCEKYFAMPEKRRNVDFNTWWEQEEVFQSAQSSLTRKDLILSVVNKDGGAHFDSKVDKKYDDFRHSWSGGSSLTGINSGIARGYDNIPIYPAVRQVAYELLLSLKP